jgi:hypothetical protein
MARNAHLRSWVPSRYQSDTPTSEDAARAEATSRIDFSGHSGPQHWMPQLADFTPWCIAGSPPFIATLTDPDSWSFPPGQVEANTGEGTRRRSARAVDRWLDADA